MAKNKRALTLKNAEIDLENLTVVERDKDGDIKREYDLVKDILQQFEDRDDLSISISYTEGI